MLDYNQDYVDAFNGALDGMDILAEVMDGLTEDELIDDAIELLGAARTLLAQAHAAKQLGQDAMAAALQSQAQQALKQAADKLAQANEEE